MAKKTTYDRNIEIENLIASRKQSGSFVFTDSEKEFISQYTGSGGQGNQGAKGEGLLYEFYTPDYIAELMWQLAHYHGYDGGFVLEPSIATGACIKHAPDKSKVVGFEINDYTAEICKILYPQITLHKGYFETAFLQEPRFNMRIKKAPNTWLPQYPFSLVIGNPPYGKHINLYSSLFKTPQMYQIEIFFMYYGLQLLKKGGLVVYLTSSNFLRNGISYQSTKHWIGQIADLVDAYRLPTVFSHSQVPTDIIVLKRK